MKRMNDLKRFASGAVAFVMAAQLTACGGGASNVNSGVSATNAPTITAAAAPGAASAASTGFNAPDAANLDTSGEYLRAKNKVTLRFGMSQHPNITDYKVNKLTQWLEETANVNLEFDLYPSSDAASKIRILIASGSDMPDAFLMASFPALDVYNYGLEGAIIPLQNYIETYGTYYKQMLASDENYTKLLTMPDGNIYSVPDITESIPNCYSQRAWINKKWLDTLGLQVPSTTEELHDVLKAFVNNDPNGNKKKDEIGVAGSAGGWRQQGYNWIMNAFIYSAPNNNLRINISDDGQTIFSAATTDEWRSGLAYMNRLSNEGLYSPIAFTQDEKQYEAMLNTEAGSIVGLITSGAFSINREEALDYVPLAPITGPKGVSWATYYPVVPQHSMLITNTSKNPGAVFAVAEAFLSPEGSKRSRFGEEGAEHLAPKAGDVSMLESLGYKPSLTPKAQWGANTNAWWQTMHPTYRSWDLIAGQVWNGNPLDGQYIVCQAVPLYYGKQPAKVISTLLYTQEEADSIRDPQNTISSYIGESIARFITGDLNINDDNAWAQYLKELDNMGIKDVMKINQTVYDRMYK